MRPTNLDRVQEHPANQTNETALMVQVGTNCGVDLAVLGALVEAGHSSIISLSGLHAGFVWRAQVQLPFQLCLGL